MYYFCQKPLFVEFKNTTIFLGNIVHLLLALSFVVISSTMLYSQNTVSKDKFTVVLDAGHGGKDSGNRGNQYYEKHIVLKVVLKIGAILSKDPNIDVIYTRKSDVFIPLNKRADIANTAKADLFVSIHCDAHTSNAYGAGTFVLGLHENDRNFRIAQKENSVIFLEENYEKKYDGFDPNNPESVISLVLMQETYLDQSIQAANTIQQSFVQNLKRKNRTVKQAGFLVLRNTYMPSVLVELGFLTNKKEGAYLNSSKGQEDMSKAISKAVLRYKKLLESNLQNEIVFDNSSDESKIDETFQDYIFRVQISASKTNMEAKSYNFKGLSPLTRIKSGTLYKYFLGNEKSYEAAQSLRKQAIDQGFSGSFVVVFKGDQIVPLSDVLKRN
ncbi:MAG: N-acetylmuramoyl-L-alanine amidase [Flavobacteriaceae bacterium]|nr:N-acetylmuramoyl-L-alanine amidase [Flavobacteriaceae bacterium]